MAEWFRKLVYKLPKRNGKVVIAFTGSHCVGKTTMMHKVAKLIENDGLTVDIIPEVTRKVPKEALGTFEGQKMIVELIREQISEHLRNNVDVILSDRSPLDTIYYTIYYMIDKSWTLKELDQVIDLISDAYADMINYIDMHVFIMRSNSVRLVDDGFRLFDERSRTIVDLIAKLLNVMNCDVIPTLFIKPSGDPDRDAQYIYDSLVSYANSDKIRVKPSINIS